MRRCAVCFANDTPQPENEERNNSFKIEVANNFKDKHEKNFMQNNKEKTFESFFDLTDRFLNLF